MKLFADIKVRLPRSFDKIAHSDATGGIIMLCCIVLALILQNGSYSTSYRHWLDTTAGVVFGDFILMKPLLLWINDGLITVFFFSIGLQLKIEFVEGHLSNPSNIVLPSLAAIAGICLPALIFFLFNFGDSYAMRGWAIPTSHDTAFSVALLMVLGKRVPNSLKILLLSISVFDDLGSMFIVAVFYNDGLDVNALIPAFAAVAGMIVLNFFGVGRKSLYIALGVILWFSILKSGVHATSAGIITAFCMPMRSRSGEQVVHEVSDNLALWVSLIILPLFTLANAGVDLGDINLSTIFSSVSMGIFLGLVIGKPMGMFSIMYVASRLKLVELPNDVTMKQVYGMCTLTGIGFSMSMFYDSLAYEGSNIYGYADALAILLAALVSGIYGFCFLRYVACKTPMIEYRPWLPAPTGYHGTARTANLYSIEKPVQGPASVAPTAALVAEANKRNAAAAEAAEAARKAAEAASKAAEIIKKAAEVNDENKEQTIAEVQLAAAQAAKAAATVAVTATKLDDSDDHAETAETVETVLKTASQVAEEAQETVAEVREAAEADDDDSDVEDARAEDSTQVKAKSKSDSDEETVVAVSDKNADLSKDTDARIVRASAVADSVAQETQANSKTKQADEAIATGAVSAEAKSASVAKKSEKKIEVVETVIAVNSSGQAKVEKTVVKTTVEELKNKQQAANDEDAPLNADDYTVATTTSAAATEVSDDSSRESVAASAKAKQDASEDKDAIATEDDGKISATKSDTNVAKSDSDAETAKADKKAKDAEDEDDYLADLKPVKKPKSKTKYELGEEDEDDTYETIAEHKEVAHETAKAVVEYLSRIAGKAKVEVSGNIERSEEEKAAARAAAAAKVAAIRAAELESQAQADAAVAQAKAKAAAEAAHKTLEKVEKEAAAAISTNGSTLAAAAASSQTASTAAVTDLTAASIANKSDAPKDDASASNATMSADAMAKSAADTSGTLAKTKLDESDDGHVSSASSTLVGAAKLNQDVSDVAAQSMAGASDNAEPKVDTRLESLRKIELADGETISEAVLESSSDAALAAIAAAESEVAKAEAEAEAAKAKAQEAKEAVAKAAEEARVAAEIAAAKKSEGKQKAKAQHALEEAQKKAAEAEDAEHDAKAKDKEESDTLSEVTATVADAVSTVASVVAGPAVKAAKIVSATASVTASVTAAAVKAAAKVVESKDKDKEKADHSKDGDTLVKEIITAKDPRFTQAASSAASSQTASAQANTAATVAVSAAAVSATAAAAGATSDTVAATASASANATNAAKPASDSASSSDAHAIAASVTAPAVDKAENAALQNTVADNSKADVIAAKVDKNASVAKTHAGDQVEPLTLAEVANRAAASSNDGELSANSFDAEDKTNASDAIASEVSKGESAAPASSATDEVDTENLTVKDTAVKKKATAKAVDIDALTLDEVTFKPSIPLPIMDRAYDATPSGLAAAINAAVERVEASADARNAVAADEDAKGSELGAADDVDTDSLTVKDKVVKSKASTKAVEIDALTLEEVVSAVASTKELDESGYTQKADLLDEVKPHADISVKTSDSCDVDAALHHDDTQSSAQAEEIEPLMADDYKHANKDYTAPNSVKFNDAEVKDDSGSVKSVVGKLADIIRKSKD